MENKYQNGKIYKITDNNCTKMYIGSTTKDLAKRFVEHQSSYKKYLSDNDKAFNTAYILFDEFGMENCQISMLALYPCNSKAELFRKEGEYILQNACVNRIVSGRTPLEYYEQRKDTILERQKVYYQTNIHRIKADRAEYRKQHRDAIRESGRDFYQRNKDNIKEASNAYYYNNKDKVRQTQIEYYKENKDKVLKQQQDYYIANKDKIDKYRNSKCICSCGGQYTKVNWTRHNKTKIHLKWLEEHRTTEN